MRIRRRVWVRELLCRRVAREPVGQQRGSAQVRPRRERRAWVRVLTANPPEQAG